MTQMYVWKRHWYTEMDAYTFHVWQKKDDCDNNIDMAD